LRLTLPATDAPNIQFWVFAGEPLPYGRHIYHELAFAGRDPEAVIQGRRKLGETAASTPGRSSGMRTSLRRVRCLVAASCLLMVLPAAAWGSPAGTLSTVAGGLASGAPTTIPQNPSAVAKGPDGSLYVVDRARDVINRITPAGVESAFAGNGAEGLGGDGGPATSAFFQLIQRVAVDGQGNVLISQVDAVAGKDALIRVVAGSDCAAGSCPFGFAGAMTKGNIYRLAGKRGATASVPDGTVALDAQLREPQGMATNARRDLIFADALDSTVRLVAASDCAAGTCPFGFTGAMTKGRIYTVATALNRPTGLAVDARGDIVVAVAGGNTIGLLIASDCVAGTCPFGIAGAPAAGQFVSVATGLAGPAGVAVGARGDIVFAETGGAGSDVKVIAASGCSAGTCPFGLAGSMTTGTVATVAGTPGTAGDSPDGTPALSAQLYRPEDVAVGAGGELLIADPGLATLGNNQMTMVVPSTCSAGSCPYGYPGALTKGAMSTVAGLGTYTGYAAEGAPAAGVAVDRPFGVAVGARGDVVFTQFRVNMVRAVAGADCAAGTCPFGFAGAMTKGGIYTVAGKLLGLGLAPDGTVATNAALDGPTGVTMDARGDLLFAEAGNDTVELVAASDCATGTCPFGFAGPMTKGAIYTIAGNGTTGTPSNGAVATTAPLDFPGGIAVDGGGNLVIAAYLNNAVELVPGSDCAAGTCPYGYAGAMTKGHIYAIAGTPGAPGFSTDGTSPTSGQLGGPATVALDGRGDLLIGDHAADVVELVAGADCAAGTCPFGFPTAMTKGNIYRVAGTATVHNLSPNGTPALNAALSGITGVAVDAGGNLLVSNDTGGVVSLVAGADCAAFACRYGFPGTMTKGAVYTIAGIPLLHGFAPDGTAATSGLLNAPQALALGASGNLLFADIGNGRIRELGAAALPPPTPGTPGGPTAPTGPPPSSPPPPPPPASGGATTDRTAPQIRSASLTNRRFAAGKAVTAAKKKRAPVGTTIRLTLTEAATVSISVEQRAAGRRSGKRCVRPTKKLIKAKARRCTLTITLGSFTRKVGPGAVKIPFTGRLARGALKPGTYVLRLLPTDAAGNRGAAKTTSFTIVKR
jgi:hypothetical protein